MAYAHTVGHHAYRFDDLKSLLAKATPPRSGDPLAGIAAWLIGAAQQLGATGVPLTGS